MRKLAALLFLLSLLSFILCGCNVSVLLTWDASAGATSYNIYRNGALFSRVTGGTEFRDTSTESGNSYYVTAVAGTLESTPSNTVSVP